MSGETSTKRLSKSNIEYLDLNWGIFSGCENIEKGICKVKACWAKGIALHYKKNFPYGFKPTFYLEALESPLHKKKPSRIGVGWVGDIIGYGKDYLPAIFNTIRGCPQHTFIFLTKNSYNLRGIEFPDNCWVGVTTTGFDGNSWLEDIFRNVHAKTKFVSIEPLLDYSPMDFRWVDWITVGAQTRPNVDPHLDWVIDIVNRADKENKPVFLKDNLLSMLTKWSETNSCGKAETMVLNTLYDGDQLRQEYPNVV